MRVPASLRSTRANTYSISRLTPAGAWTYAGSCYQSEGDTWLAAAAARHSRTGIAVGRTAMTALCEEARTAEPERCGPVLVTMIWSRPHWPTGRSLTGSIDKLGSRV
jgi:hypothetical protein